MTDGNNTTSCPFVFDQLIPSHQTAYQYNILVTHILSTQHITGLLSEELLAQCFRANDAIFRTLDAEKVGDVLLSPD